MPVMTITVFPHKPQVPTTIKPIFVLGIESSCDETATAILQYQPDKATHLLSSVIASQDTIHRPYGGIVPEIAARAHLEKIDTLIKQAMLEAGLEYGQLSAIAATAGPGLIGGVITGLMTAKGLALALNRPLLAINHLEGHALSARLTAHCPFPYLLLLVSGGHSQLLAVAGVGNYKRLGSSVDDAAGEAFDKTAKVIGAGFPGGPHIERLAAQGNKYAIDLPRPFKGTSHANFSFSGLKTAVVRAWQKSARNTQARQDIAASFQQAMCEIIHERTAQAMQSFKQYYGQNPIQPHTFVVAGGVAANQHIRKTLTDLCAAQGFHFLAPPPHFCTDNAAMIALAGAERFIQGDFANLSVKARPRWPLDASAAYYAPASGHGRKGPKS